MSLSVAVFASGSGTNLQALLHHESARSPWIIRLAVSERKGTRALERAAEAGKEGRVIPVRGRAAGEVGTETLALLAEMRIDVILLAGYLQRIPASVVRAYRRRILNIHPALLPSFGGRGMYGRRVHEAVLASGARVSGPTIHYVDEGYDTGRIFAQWPVPVRRGDTPEELAARVLRVEHILYPLAADDLCAGLSRGEDPEPFSPAGDLFAIASDPPEEEIARAIRRAFRAASEGP